ncbi:MAG: minor capsid protein [Synergistaceae bacterium]|nr:minor capsid protein [Synergistaceae bacterium]
MSVISYLTPLGKREARLRLSLILEHLNIKINKAAKKDPAKELLKLERKLSAELVKNWRESYTDALRDLFKNLPGFISQDAKKIIEDSLLDALGVSFGSAKNVRLLMRERIEDAYILGKSLFNLNKDLKSALSLSDRKAIDVLTRHNCFWLGEHYGKHIGPKISELTQQALDEGLGRDALAENLKQELGSVSPKGYSYFDVVASSALVRARSFGSIAGMEEAGIAEYEILAMGDERTCPICGEMNGKKFSVAQTREVINKVLDIQDPEKFKEAMPWQTTPPKNKSESKLSEDGQSLPPFHGRCRCTLVMTETVRESVSAVENNSDKILDLETPIVDNANNKTNGNIPEAKTIEEANELAVNLGIAKRADFSGLDISAVNELIVGVMNAKNLFPELETLDYVGSMQKMIRNWKHYAQAYAITSNKNPLGIGLNIDKLSIDGIINSKKNLVKDVASKFRPIGCETIKAIIDHEIGHLIDFSLNASKDKQIIALFRSCKKLGVEAMENSLSCYSNTNIREFIAEAWGEYQNNKSPRPIAKIVGQRLLDLSKERRQTKNDDES